MLKHTYEDSYETDPATGKPRVVTQYGIGIETGRRSYGFGPDHQPILDAAGNDGKDTVTAVMITDGTVRTFDVDQVEAVKAG